MSSSTKQNTESKAKPILPEKTQSEKLTPEEAKEKFRKPNYWKYHSVKPAMKEMLLANEPAKEIAKKLCISQPTFYKYKSLLCCEGNARLQTFEERSFLKK